jgi:hypothetical protein
MPAVLNFRLLPDMGRMNESGVPASHFAAVRLVA